MAKAHAHPAAIRSSARPEVDPAPTVRTISVADVKAALAQGYDDFLAMPRHTPFLGIIYALVCFFLVRMAFNYSLLPLVFPLIAGMALLGPFAAVGLYDLSRRREQGLDTGLRHAFAVGKSPQAGSIVRLGLALVAVFFFWLMAAFAIFQVTIGEAPAGPVAFLQQVLTTPGGWALIIIGNGVGALFALGVFATTVVSFPMLVDRRVTVGTAVETSIAAVRANPGPMLTWAAIVVGLLALGALPLFVGLAVVLPVLGHATWHLYRRVVV